MGSSVSNERGGKHENRIDGVKIKATAFKTHTLNGKVAFIYGPLTLASDEQKRERELKKPVALEKGFACQEKQAEKGEIVRFECDLCNGDILVLADYQSCGKK